MHKTILEKVIKNEKLNKTFAKPTSHKAPIRHQEIIERLYKKQLPDKIEHLEMIEKIEKPSKPKVLSKKSGGMEFFKEPPKVVEGSKPLDNIASEPQFVLASGKPSDKMKRRSEKIKEIMKQKGLKLVEASKYIKANNIKY